MVGSSQNIECRVDTTVAGVSSVMISWTGPGGVAIMNNSRMSVSQTSSNGNVFTSVLQFTYLMEGDEGSYTCNWMILQNSGSQSVELQSLTGKMFVLFLLICITVNVSLYMYFSAPSLNATYWMILL